MLSTLNLKNLAKIAKLKSKINLVKVDTKFSQNYETKICKTKFSQYLKII